MDSTGEMPVLPGSRSPAARGCLGCRRADAQCYGGGRLRGRCARRSR